MMFLILMFSLCVVVYGLRIQLPFHSKVAKVSSCGRDVKSSTALACVGKILTPVEPRSDNDDNYWRSKANPNIIKVKRSKFTTKPELITFDAFNTLIQPSQSMGRWYREALNTACGMNIRLPRPAMFTASFNREYKAMCDRYPCYGAKNGMTSEEWWAQTIERTYRGTENLNQIEPNEFPEVLPQATELLYRDIFGTKEGWVVKENVEYTLRKLAEWRDQGAGPKLAVVSNSDERLRNVLDELNLGKYFDFVLTSHEVGHEKPDPQLFQLAQTIAKVSSADKAFHIGDSLETDIAGAVAAGWTAMHFYENFDEAFPDWSETDTPDKAHVGQEKAFSYLNYGRKDLRNGNEWVEIWGLDEVLTMFGFPDDPDKPIRSTLLKGVYED